MTSIADIKSAFADHQHQTAVLFNALVAEIVALNQKVKELTPPEAKEEKKA